MNSPHPPHLWLAANHRPAQVATLFSATFFVSAGLFSLSRGPISAGIALGLLAAAIVAIWVTYRLWQPPRIRYERPHLVLRFPGVDPFLVPLEVVECFFIGSAKYQRPGSPPRESIAVIIRIAERAREWSQCEVPAHYGEWRNGYVVLDGTYCEPITAAKVRQFNHWLVAAKKSPPITESLV